MLDARIGMSGVRSGSDEEEPGTLPSVATPGLFPIEYELGGFVLLDRGSIMPVVISDETLSEAGLSEREGLVEIACRLFEAGRLTLWSAARLAQLSRVAFEQELQARHIARYRPTVADLEADLNALDQLGI